MINLILDKVLSARFIITVCVGFTYCVIVRHAVNFYLESMKNNPDRMEAFVTGLIMGFSSIATLVIKAYFDRQDRPLTSGSQTDETTATVTSIVSTPASDSNVKP